MPKPYSADLRRKVVEAIVLDGMKRCEAHEHFHVSRGTINDWLKRYAASGDIQPTAREYRGHSHKITDWQAFRAFAVKHADKTQEEMAELWPDEISDRTISRALQKINFTQKKDLRVQRTRRTSASGFPQAISHR
jgi:transposase